MVGSDNWQEATRSAKPDHLLHLTPIDFADNAGQKLGMTIPFEQIETCEYLIKLLRTSNTRVFHRVKRIEADRKRYSEIIELFD